MKSCFLIIVAILILAALGLSLGTLFFVSSDTQVVEPIEASDSAE